MVHVDSGRSRSQAVHHYNHKKSSITTLPNNSSVFAVFHHKPQMCLLNSDSHYWVKLDRTIVMKEDRAGGTNIVSYSTKQAKEIIANTALVD